MKKYRVVHKLKERETRYGKECCSYLQVEKKFLFFTYWKTIEVYSEFQKKKLDDDIKFLKEPQINFNI